ncbi:hypothetical protein [Massilia glaciei]|uniref:hypothetical protein n=1 Tax=Massilia glaciei TaxID=1524097 RepID=UPI0015E7F151|nr:hypothetical protein [Massilia glaciei]
MNSFIVEFWSRVFAALGRISLFTLVRAILPFPVTARLVDAWVLGHLGLSLVTLVVVANYPRHWFAMALVGYGVVRVFEVAIYQANVLMFDEYRAVKAGRDYALEGYRRMVLLLVHNYFEIIFWLAGTYIILGDEFSRKWAGGTGTVLGGIYSSFITMTTFGEFDLAPKTTLGAGVLLFHTTVGLFMTLLSLARFISLIPAPKSKDPVELRQPPEPPPRPPRRNRR